MVAFAFLISILLSGSSCTADYPFRNVTLSWNERVDDLVSRLTLEEIMYQMARGGGGPDGGPAPAIPRLGIGPYQWTTECLSGDVFKNTTSFPMPIGMGASFSPDLMFRVAEAIGIEVRAMYNDYRKQGDYHMHTSISCLSPVINIMRHPFWGRNQEVYGEDPFLSGVLATNYVKGLQGNHSRYVRANAGCKHFDAYAGPDNVPSSRFTFNAIVSERDLRLTFLPAFRKCVEAGTYNLMCSYNSINGIPACSNYKLLTTILRDEWNFTGYVIADFDAIQYTMTQHKFYYNSLEAVTGSVNAGCNLEFPGDGAVPVYYSMLDAINKTMLLESTVREKVKPLFYTRMRLGEFDPPSMNPYTQLNLSVIESNTHRQLAVEAAVKSFVLLKKEANFIHLKKTLSKIAIIGPMANNSKELFGDYSPFTDPKFTSVPLDGLRKLSKNVAYTPGCNDGNKCIKYSTQEVQLAVQGADVVFVCLGTGTDIEAENNDRRNMDLPGKQLTLLQDAVTYGKRVILLIFSSGPVNISWAEFNASVAIIIQCFFPAQATGEALYSVFSDVNTNLAGRLPYTWYRNADQIPSMTNYSMADRTYRYFTGEPLYPFGYGLSFTTFNYSYLQVPSTIKAGDPLQAEVTVTNTGILDGDEVVQVYIAWLTTTEVMPNLQLVAFDRIFVPRSKSVRVTLSISPRDLAVWNDDKGFVIESGSVEMHIGGQQPNQKKKVDSNVLSSVVKIIGSKHIK